MLKDEIEQIVRKPKPPKYKYFLEWSMIPGNYLSPEIKELLVDSEMQKNRYFTKNKKWKGNTVDWIHQLFIYISSLINFLENEIWTKEGEDVYIGRDLYISPSVHNILKEYCKSLKFGSFCRHDAHDDFSDLDFNFIEDYTVESGVIEFGDKDCIFGEVKILDIDQLKAIPKKGKKIL